MKSLQIGLESPLRQLAQRGGQAGLGAGKVNLVGYAMQSIAFAASGRSPVPLPPGTEFGDLILSLCASLGSTNPPSPGLDRGDSSFNSNTGMNMSCGASIHRADVVPGFGTNKAGTFTVGTIVLRGMAALDVDADAFSPPFASAAGVAMMGSAFVIHALVGSGTQTAVGIDLADVVSLGRISAPNNVTLDLFKLEDIPAGTSVNRAFVYGSGSAPNNRAVASFSLVGVQGVS